VLQTEALQQKTEEAQKMREKVMALELTISSGAEEKGQCEVMVLLIILLCLKVRYIYLS
jgi:hypothetical protein